MRAWRNRSNQRTLTSARRPAGRRSHCWWARLSPASRRSRAVCYLYFVAAYEAGKHALCCLETMPFDTRGALWFDGVAQTHTALFIALVVQRVVLWFNFTKRVLAGVEINLRAIGQMQLRRHRAMAWGARNLISTQVLAGHRRHPHPAHVEALPGRCRRRHATRNLHGLARGEDAAEGQTSSTR